MQVKTDVRRNVVKFSWKGKLRYIKRNEVSITYDVDISKTPKHLLNFMFGAIMSEHFAWNPVLVEFEELTRSGIDCLNNYILMNYASNRYGRIASTPGKVSSKNLLEEETRGINGPVLCANGMGKNGLMTANMVKELGFDLRCFTVGNQYKNNVLWKERIKTMNKFYESKKIQSNIIMTDYMVGTQFKIIPWWVFGLPLAYHYDSDAILAGLSIHLSKTRIDNNAPFCPGCSIFSFDCLTKGTGITFSSPGFPVSDYGSQKVLADRYPESLRYQRSCMQGIPWCNDCAKCHRHSLYVSMSGKDPTSIGLNQFRREIFSKCVDPSHPGLIDATLINLFKKWDNKPYKKWIDGANQSVIDLIWSGKEVKNILREHCDIYSYDPGSDGTGCTVTPSKWQGWMDKGLLK